MKSTTTITASDSTSKEQWFGKIGAQYNEHRKILKNSLKEEVGVAQKVRVAGFEIDITNSNAAKELRTAIVNEAIETKKFKSKLKAAGIEPVAILPKNVWDKIIEKANFFTFYRLQADGTAYANGHNLLRLSFTESYAIHALVNAGLPFVFGLVSLIVALAGWVSGLMPQAVICLSYSMPQIVFALIYDNNKVGWAKKAFLISAPVMMCFYLSHQKKMKGKTKDLLWPKRTDIAEENKDLIPLILPVPPEYTKSILSKCYAANIPSYLSMHPNAFEVKITQQTYDDLRLKYDPVIFTTQGDLVAVLDQFGDFPEEKEVIRYITEHFDALRKDIVPLQAN